MSGALAAMMPRHAPLYPPPPYTYSGAEAVIVRYETDRVAAESLLPAGLELQANALVVVIVVDYADSTFGPYREAIQGIECLWRDERRTAVVAMALTSDAGCAAGREIWGFPKKMAAVTLEREDGRLRGTAVRQGELLVSASVVPTEALGGSNEVRVARTVTERLVPSPEEGAPLSLSELVESVEESTTRNMWRGTGELELGAEWAALPVVRVDQGFHRTYDARTPHGRVLGPRLA